MGNIPEARARGWQVLLGGVLAYSAIVAAASRWFPVSQVLRKLGVLALDPSFADLRNILSAMECQRQGFDVLLRNPCDPWQRPMDYPRLWLWPGLDQSWTLPIGFAMGVLFVGAVFWLFRTLDRRTAAVALCIVLSPAVVLVVERGNIDELIFAGMICALAIISQPSQSRRAGGYVLLAVLGMAKLFPFAAFAVAVRERRPWAIAVFAAATATAAAYAFATWRDLQELAQVVPRPLSWAYGIKVLPLQIVRYAGYHGIAVDPMIAAALAYLAFALLAAGGFRFARRLRNSGEALPLRLSREAEIDFIAGSAIYLFSFIMMQNFIYRLIFLLPCLPQFFAWYRSSGPLRRLGAAGILAFVVATWAVPLMAFVRRLAFGVAEPIAAKGFEPDQLAEWALAVVAWIGLLLALFRTDDRVPGAEQSPAAPAAGKL